MSAATSSVLDPKAVGMERRAFYRINDAIGLKLNKLDRTGVVAVKERISRQDYENKVVSGGDGARQFQAALREVESKNPEISHAFRLLETRVEALAEIVSSQQAEAIEAPNVVANLSGNGMGVEWPSAFFEGDQLLVEITLFPSRRQINALAKVVRGNPDKRATNGCFQCPLEFVEIASNDREALLQHIHSLQIDALRSQNEAVYA